MPARILKEFLDREHVRYISVQHSPAYTAQEVAQSAHVPGREMAKTVILKIGQRLAMAVLPANQRILLGELREMLGTDDVQFATEEEFRTRFPDCETGAMPPFGNLYGMDVYVAPGLAADPEIAFNAGSHTEVIRMAYPDFERLVHPQVLSFST